MSDMDEYKEQEKPEAAADGGLNPEKERTRAIPAAREEETAPAEASSSSAPRRRRRSERYHSEEIEAEEEPESRLRSAAAPVVSSASATAREAAERMGLRPRTEDTDPQAGSRIPPQAAAWNRARAAENAAPRKGMSEAARVRMAGAQRVGQDSGRHMESVGYAPGRMAESNPAQAAAARARMEAQRAAGSPSLRYGDGGRGTPPRDGRFSMPPEGDGRKKHRGLNILLIILLIIGVLVVALLAIPADTPGLPGEIKRTVTGLLGGNKQEENASGVLSFTASGNENAVAPTDVSFSIKAARNVSDIQLINEAGEILACSRMTANNTDHILWTLTWHLEDGYEGEVGLQAKINEEWVDTPRKIAVSVASLNSVLSASPELTVGIVEVTPVPTAAPEAEITAEPEKTAEITAEPEKTAEITAEPENQAENTVPPDLPGIVPEDIDPGDLSGAAELPEDPEAIGAENPEDDPEMAGDAPEGEDPEMSGDAPEGGDPEMTGEEPEARETAAALNNLPVETPPAEEGSEASGEGEAAPGVESAEPTAEPTPEVTEEPKLTVKADEEADPAALISQSVIYNGTKKASEYSRAKDDMITMPVVGEYTKQPMGVLTYRMDAFRQNAAAGTVGSAAGLEIAWTADAGSVKGSGQTFYGVSWTGQPAIVKWSREVRELSDMMDSKKEKTGLKEVIVAGLDGNIYFLDLADGTPTRSSIRLGYPMKGTPSVHPGGAPYFSVGQYARKMASGTGKIGLRQYNLYTNKEMTLIDGLDGKNNRAYNAVGSFETSALIDRTSDTLITAGTNGLLYVIRQGSTFDYKMGTYTLSPAQVVFKSKAKGETDAQTAVEASVAMYDKYVYYADMGGILRCVDTNTMTICWAVKLADAVESTPALDFSGTQGLNLYTATLLNNRKKGDAEVSCYDALSGKRIWTTAFGVQKDTKNKTVSGFRASPVVGQNNLGSLVYYTVNNLSEDGRALLGVGEETAAVVAMYKGNGQIAWARGLSGRGYSSPVAVYDGSGNGWIIQCAGDGSILLLEGLTGRVVSSLTVEGAIEASPAVYNDMLVVATSQKGANHIYGIQIK